MKKTNAKLYKLFNDVNRHSKKYINEDKYSREVRKANEYCKKNNVANGIKVTYSTGVRTYKNFGVYDVEPNTMEIEEKKKTLDETKVAYNYIKLMMNRNK